MPVVVKSDDAEVEFMFVRSSAEAVTNVIPSRRKRVKLNSFNVLKGAAAAAAPTHSQEGDGGGILLPLLHSCNTETKSPYILDLLDCIRTTRVFGPLWTKRESDLISMFLKLSIPTQDFFIRLCYRKLSWHRFLGVINLARIVSLVDETVMMAASSEMNNNFDFELKKKESKDLSPPRFQMEEIHNDNETLLNDHHYDRSSSSVEDSDIVIFEKLLCILRELVEPGLVYLFPASISGRKEKKNLLEALRCIPGKHLDKICKRLKPRGLQVTAAFTKACRIKELERFSRRNTLDNRFNPMSELRDAVGEQLLEGTTGQDTGFALFKLNEEFKYLLRRIMRLADLPTWSSTASTGCYISILSASYSRGFLIRMGRCLPPPPMVEATTSYNNVGASSSSDMLPSRTEFLRMEAAHEAAACQTELVDLPIDEAMLRAKHVASCMERLGVPASQCLPDGKVWSKNGFYTIGAELCWVALQTWYSSPNEKEQVEKVNELKFPFRPNPDPSSSEDTSTISPQYLVETLNTWLIERRHVHEPIPFYRQFESGTTLSTGLWNGVAIFEKDKSYMRAVLSLMTLLQVGFTPHRRGKYWDRLRIDLMHLYRVHKNIVKLGSLIDKVVLVALADPAVEAGFRMKLERSIRHGSSSLPFQSSPPSLLPELFGDPHITNLHNALVKCDYMVKRYSDSSFNGYCLKANSLNTSETRGKSGKILYVGEDGEVVNVEELVLQAFYYGRLEHCLPEEEEEGLFDESSSSNINDVEWRGIHDEGRIMGCLVPLFLWDALFSQDAPLDLDCAFHSFYINRKDLLRKLLDNISNSSPVDLCCHLRKIWLNNKSSFGIRWMATCWNSTSQGGRIIPGPFPWGIRLLQLLAMGLGGKTIAAICTAYVYSSRRFSSGQPDLLLLRVRRCKDNGTGATGFQTLNPSELLFKGLAHRKKDENNKKPWLLPSKQSAEQLWSEKEGVKQVVDMSLCMIPLEDKDVEGLDVEAMFVEVKSENDSLSAKQRAWQLVLREAMGKNRAMVVKVEPLSTTKSSK